MNKSKVMQKASPPSLKRSNSMNGRKSSKSKRLLREMVGGEPYEYYKLGRYIVSAPGVCGGRPTFKYTRIDVRHALSLVSAGWPVEMVAKDFDLPVQAVKEAVKVASKALDKYEGAYAQAA
jgi:uncharacterized protein (DUF433 family)